MDLRPATVLLFALALPAPGAAQLVPVPGLGSPAEDRVRMEQVLGEASSDGFLLRRTTPDPEGEGWLLSPDVVVTWNSALPVGRNDGLLWSGRGISTRVRAGAMAEWKRLRLVLVPEFAYVRNRGFEVLPSEDATRSPFASPFYGNYRNSADLPLRFGTRPFGIVHPGQSTLSVDAGPVRAGASTANQWWGPGIRNALVLSDHAPGFPHLFLETDRPLDTPLGPFEGRWIVGSLLESPYFDYHDHSDLRSLSGLVVTLRPGGLETLTLGFARSVIAPMDEFIHFPARFHQVLTRWDPLPSSPKGVNPPPTDGLYSLFARWSHPDAGVEVYGEWAHTDFPASVREFLTAPQHSQAWIVGLQWVDEREDGSPRARLQGEVTMLEQTRILPDREKPPTYYSGRSAPHGFTHRGQVLGAAAGPGGSEQWLAGDYLAGAWSLGAFVGRSRHNNDALYWQHGINFHRHDVTVRAGIRGDVTLGGWRLYGRFSREKRFNYLFQNGFANPGGIRTVDVVNLRGELGARVEGWR